MPIAFPPMAQGSIFNSLTAKSRLDVPKAPRKTIAEMRFPIVNPMGTPFTDGRVFKEVLGFPSGFDESLMAAMNRPWPDILFSPPKVVASGMIPSDLINP